MDNNSELLKLILANVANNKEVKRLGLENKLTKMESLFMERRKKPKLADDVLEDSVMDMIDVIHYVRLVKGEMDKEIQVRLANLASTSSNAN